MLGKIGGGLELDVDGSHTMLAERTDMASRLLAAARKGAASAALEIEEQLLTQLSELQPNQGGFHGLQATSELTHLVQSLSEGQALLRAAYSACLGRFCMQALSMLSAVEDSWPAVLATLRLMEGVLLICVGEQAGEIDQLLQVLQPLLRRNYLPRNTIARIESAVMSMLGPQMRNLYAPERPLFGPQEYGEAETHLWKVVKSLSSNSEMAGRRRKVMAAFDKVIFECFGVHCEEFGSGVNGFQMKTSDIDISVSLPPAVREKLLQGRMVVQEEAASTKRKREAATVAVRVLADQLQKSGINVIEVVDTARVPIVKCRHVLPAEEKLYDKRVEEQEFEVDVSFCNEVALYNSQMLRAYAKFDIRAQALGVLVKHWAKQRGIRSSFDGTLSSYAYTLMVIHFLQRCHILPNLQKPPEELKKKLGVVSTESLLEEGNNVWFLKPQEHEKVMDPETWLGCKRNMEKLCDLFSGFFRYFALEFNMYSEVVSIRLSGKLRKLEYFGSAFGDTGKKEQEQAAEQLEEEVSTANVAVHDGKLGSVADVQQLANEPPKSYVGLSVVASTDSEEETVLCKAKPAPSWPSSATAATDESDCAAQLHPEPAPEPVPEPVALSEIGANSSARLAPLPEVLVGRLMKFNKDKGFGFISCPATHARFSRDVFLHQKQFWEAQQRDGVEIGNLVLFTLSVRDKGRPQARNLRKAPGDARETLPEVMRAEEGQGRDEADGGGAGLRPPGSSTLSPEMSRLINSRLCLCIDDPMEKYRTLGTTLAGQDELSKELRRAVSILKRGADYGYNLKALLEQPDMSVPQRERECRRDYSPIPRRSEDTCEVELQRGIRWDHIKRLPEPTLVEIQQRTGVAVLKIISEQDHLNHETWSVLIRGSMGGVSKALQLVEQQAAPARKPTTKENRHAEMLQKAQSFKAPSLTVAEELGSGARTQLDADRATLGRNGAQLSQMFLPASSSARLQSINLQASLPSAQSQFGQPAGFDIVRQQSSTSSATKALASSVAAKLLGSAAELARSDAGGANGSLGAGGFRVAGSPAAASFHGAGAQAQAGGGRGGAKVELASVLAPPGLVFPGPSGSSPAFVPPIGANANHWSGATLGQGLVPQ